MKRIYADNSATTQVREECIEVMLSTLKDCYGNSSSVHTDGRKAKALLEIARENISSALSCQSKEIVFTSGGSESNNLVISMIRKSVEEGLLQKNKHILISGIEHPSVKEAVEALEKYGWKIDLLTVDFEGFILIDDLKNKIKNDSALVSVIHGSNEIGTIQDLKAISNICSQYDVLFHSDVVQSFGKIPLDTSTLNIDLLTGSSHKIYGPKGAGFLYINNKIRDLLLNVKYGGSQEGGLRPGTENLTSIVGFGLAAKLVSEERKQLNAHLKFLQKELYLQLEEIDGIIFTGSRNLDLRLPGHVSFCTNICSGESLVLQLDLKGISVSSASACSSGKNAKIEPSHVIKSLNLPFEYANGSVRISFGKYNTIHDVEQISAALKTVLNKSSKVNYTNPPK